MMHTFRKQKTLYFALVLTVFIASLFAVFVPSDLEAATANQVQSRASEGTYYPLVNIPGTSNKAQGDIGSLANALFRIGIILAALLAVIMVAIGGVQYMTTDAVSGKSEGRDRIFNAVLGLILALLIWVILNEINPRIIQNLNPTIPKTQGTNLSNQGSLHPINLLIQVGNFVFKKAGEYISRNTSNTNPGTDTSHMFDIYSNPYDTYSTPDAENQFYTDAYRAALDAQAQYQTEAEREAAARAATDAYYPGRVQVTQPQIPAPAIQEPRYYIRYQSGLNLRNKSFSSQAECVRLQNQLSANNATILNSCQQYPLP